MINNENEKWMDIPHYEGLYMVSNFGRIKSVERDVFMPDGETRNGHIEEHIVPQYDNGTGYQFVILWKNNKNKREYVHRLVALAFIPNPDKKPQVDHIDTDRANNIVENLRWVTQSENNLNPITNKKMCEAQKRRAERGTNDYAKGEKNGANTHPEKNSFINNNPSKKGMEAHNKGLHWYNNGIINKQFKECPEGFVLSRIHIRKED